MKIENFEGFYNEYKRFSVKVAYRILRNKESAEDISQDVFMHFYKIRDNLDFSNEKKLESLVFTATANKCRDYLRKSWIKQEVCSVSDQNNDEKGDDRHNPEKLVLLREEKKYRKLVLEKLREVNPTNYDIFIKTKLLGMSPDIVANEYGLTRNNINNRNLRTKEWMNREIKKLRRQPS